MSTMMTAIMFVIMSVTVVAVVSVVSVVVSVAVPFVTALFMAAPLVRQVGRHGVFQIIVLVPFVAYDSLGGRAIEDLFIWLNKMALGVPNAFGLKVSYVVHTECAAQHLSPIEVVDGEYGRALVLVHKKAKAAIVPFGLLGIWLRTRLRQVDVDNFAILRKNREYVAFGHIIMQSADIDIR